ncbi:MAG: hypothetical protein E6Y02_05280 [Gemella haemolysans]|uniref:hypothetical protein n=1 Tax=Gemella haemolysans TaxID=1379 RepID=UPI00290935C7|nr:hypothetical protein [Gemella haemolysans]MDU4714386.1 hypothetical protein [Gemella haemolysans]
MEIKVIKDGTTEEMVYNGLELLEKFATKLLNQNDNAVTLETLQQDNDLYLTFVGTYLAVVPTFKDMVTEYQKIKDSETFRTKIIDREVRGLTNRVKMLEVGQINGKPTDFQVLKIQTQEACESTIAVLEKLKDTYSKDESTLRIEI